MKAKRPAGFLNVDLEIVSSSSLAPLAEEMANAVAVLHSGPIQRRKYLLALESSKSAETADATARLLCGIVEQLSSRGRKLWARASRKVFDVGYELVAEERAVHVALHPETLARIVALGATVAFTCYHHDNSEPPAQPHMSVAQPKS